MNRAAKSVGRVYTTVHRRHVSDPCDGISNRSAPPQGWGKPQPLLGTAAAYRVGAIPCGRPGGGGRPISTILNSHHRPTRHHQLRPIVGSRENPGLPSVKRSNKERISLYYPLRSI